MKREKSSPFRALLKIDLFGEKMGFNFNGTEAYPSVCGTLVSFIVAWFTFFYALQQLQTMKEYGETQFQTVREENGITEYDEFGYD